MAIAGDRHSECREWGQARIEVAKQAETREDWERLWQEPKYSYTFEWGDCWKQCVEYRVNDFAAEAGFYLDVLGLSSNAFGEDYAMVMSPDQAFYLSFCPASKEMPATPPDAVSVQFMLKDVLTAAKELESRGIVFDEAPKPFGDETSPLYSAKFRTPHGISVILWGLVEPKE